MHLPLRSLAAAGLTAVALASCGAPADDAAAPAVSEPPAAATPTPEPPASAGSDQATSDPDGPILGTQARPVLGDADAPVTIIEFSDFLCPFCERFATSIEPEIVDRYVESGQVRIVWHDFPAKGERSVAAAVAARAAHRQDAFWEYHRELFERKVSLSYSREELVGLAGELGLDTRLFEDDLDDPALRQNVLEDHARGQRFGVRGTPSFLVGDQPVVGAQPLSAFTQAIESQLAAGNG